MAAISCSGRAAFEQEAAGAGAERAEDVLVDLEGGQDDHLCGRRRLEQFGGRGDAVEVGHADVHEHDIGTVVSRTLDREPAVLRFGDDLDRVVA
jgi:hypothetical protein